jgi:hypothetical protein
VLAAIELILLALMTFLSTVGIPLGQGLNGILSGFIFLFLAWVGLFIVRRLLRREPGPELRTVVSFLAMLALIGGFALALSRLSLIILPEPTTRLGLIIQFKLGQRDFRSLNPPLRHLSEVELPGADLSGAMLSDSDLNRANLQALI